MTEPTYEIITVTDKNGGEYGEGLIVVKSHQCPYAHRLTRSIEEMAEKAHIPIRIEHLLTERSLFLQS